MCIIDSSMEIVDSQDMEMEFNGLQDALHREGFETVFQSVAQVYQSPATFVVVNSTVTAIVKIPIIPSGDVQNFHLFQHLRLPVLHEEHLMVVTSSAEMIAVNSDRLEFVSLSGSRYMPVQEWESSFFAHFYLWQAEVDQRFA